MLISSNLVIWIQKIHSSKNSLKINLDCADIHQLRNRLRCQTMQNKINKNTTLYESDRQNCKQLKFVKVLLSKKNKLKIKMINKLNSSLVIILYFYWFTILILI